MSPQPGGGLDHIRDAVTARRSQLVIIARNIGTSVDLLDSFRRGNADLPADVVDALVREIWQFVEYDPVHDVLREAPTPPAKSVGVLPKLTMKLPKYTPGPNQRPGPQPEIERPKPKSRPGWL